MGCMKSSVGYDRQNIAMSVAAGLGMAILLLSVRICFECSK